MWKSKVNRKLVVIWEFILHFSNNNNYDRVRQERSRVDFRAEIVICSIDYSNINLGGVREMIQAPRRTLFY